VRKLFSDGGLKLLKEEEVLTLQTINSFRDAAQLQLTLWKLP